MIVLQAAGQTGAHPIRTPAVMRGCPITPAMSQDREPPEAPGNKACPTPAAGAAHADDRPGLSTQKWRVKQREENSR